MAQPVAIRLKASPTADGSATFRKGNVSAFAAVFGPMEAKLRDEQVEMTTLDVKIVLLVKQFPRSLLRLATQLTGADTDSVNVTLGKILEAPADLDDAADPSAQLRDESLLDAQENTPDWLIQGSPAPPLFTRSASLRGSHKAVLINALSAALLDAAVPARGTLIAAHAILRSGGENGTLISTTHTAAEEERAVASFVCSFLFSGHQPGRDDPNNWDDLNDILVLTDALGTFDDAQLIQAITACREVAKETYFSIRQSLNA